MVRLIELKSDQGFAENRKWFSSSEMDLIVWRDESQSIRAFELNYKEAPLLIPDGTFDVNRIVRLYERLQGGLPEAIAKDIRQKLSGLVADIQKS